MQFLIFWTASESDKTPLGLFRLFSSEFPLNPAFGRFFFGKIDFEMKEGLISYVPKVSFFFFFCYHSKHQSTQENRPCRAPFFRRYIVGFQKMSAQVRIVSGANPEKYTLESGYTKDVTHVYIDTTLGNGRDTSRGVGKVSVSYDWGTSENYHSVLEKLTFPIKAEVEFDQITNGKGKNETIVVSLKPVAVSKASAASA